VPRPYRFHKLRGKLLGGLGVSAAAARGQRLVKRSHQLAAGKDYIYACPVNAIGESFMKFLPLRPKLKHVAEHGDTPAELGAGGKSKRYKRAAHRARGGVVGFIDDGDAPIFAADQRARATAGLRVKTCEGTCGKLKIGARDLHRREHRDRVLHEVAARR